MKEFIGTALVFAFVLAVMYYGFQRWDTSWCLSAKHDSDEVWERSGIVRKFSQEDAEACKSIGIILPQ